MKLEMEGFGVVFFNFVAFVLVIGALFVLVHSLTRPLDRWRVRWGRWIWVALGIEYILALTVLLIKNTNTTVTILAMSIVVALVVQTWYVARVVLAPKRPAAPEPVAETDATLLSTPTNLEEPLDADA